MSKTFAIKVPLFSPHLSLGQENIENIFVFVKLRQAFIFAWLPHFFLYTNNRTARKKQNAK